MGVLLWSRILWSYYYLMMRLWTLCGCCLSCETSWGRWPTQYVDNSAKENRILIVNTALRGVSFLSSPSWVAGTMDACLMRKRLVLCMHVLRGGGSGLHPSSPDSTVRIQQLCSVVDLDSAALSDPCLHFSVSAGSRVCVMWWRLPMVCNIQQHCGKHYQKTLISAWFPPPIPYSLTLGEGAGNTETMGFPQE